MASPSSSNPGNKRRSVGNQLSVEDNALDVIAKEADTREAKSSAFLAEARKLRSDEREKKKKENENDDEDDGEEMENNKTNTSNSENISVQKVPNLISNPKPQSIDRPVLEHANSKDSLVDIQEKYKKVLLSNAQLDNEKRALTYEVDLLKDNLWDMEEGFNQMKRNLHTATKEKDKLSNEIKDLKGNYEKLMVDLRQRDELIKTSGLALVTIDNPYIKTEDTEYASVNNMSSAILTCEHLEVLEDYTGSLGDRLKKIFDERKEILEEKEKLSKELSELKSSSINSTSHQQNNSSTCATPSFDGIIFDDTQKNFTETKLKLKKAEQEITTLQGNVTRLETQLARYKSSSENLEKSEEDLKVEKRKLQIEVRSLTSRIEELESKNNSLTKRLEKLKTKNVVDNN